jgi:tripartite-type tricarboxylate transporter receptor subunit TctC
MPLSPTNRARGKTDNDEEESMSRNSLAFLCTALLSSLAPIAAADQYPERPIRLVVPFAPGGGTDVNARILADPFSKAIGQTVVVDNRPGASSMLGTDIVAKANPDGYTLLINSISITINPAVFKKLPFDITRDFIPISLVSDQPNIMVANRSLPARTLKEFASLAQSQPGKYTFGTPGPGTGIHLATELLLQKLNLNLVHVPYKGTGPALTAILGNEIAVYVSTFASALPHVKANRMHAYAVTTAKRADPLPNVPTVAEAGVPGYEYATWYGMLAPAGTPGPIITKLNRALVATLNSSEVKRLFVSQGLTPLPTTSQEFSKHIRSELTKWAGAARLAKVAMR